MNDDIFLSIIIPYYNLEVRLLDRCLKSIFSQSLRVNFEVIVVDDGSHNSPCKCLESFDEKNIFYFYQSNKGLSSARNLGLSKARGEYIQFIDADDYLYPGTLSLCIDKLKSEKCDILSFGSGICYDFEIKSIKQDKISFNEYFSGVQYMLLHRLTACAWGYLFKRQLAEENKIRFAEGIYHEDEDFTPKLFYYAGKIITTDLTVYAYFQRADSIKGKKSHSHIEKRFEDIRFVISDLILFKEERSNDPEIGRRALECRIEYLVCESVISILREDKVRSRLKKHLDWLKDKNLYPVKFRKYSFKYFLFYLFMNNKPGLFILFCLIRLKENANRLFHS